VIAYTNLINIDRLCACMSRKYMGVLGMAKKNAVFAILMGLTK
jgi:hypothetical protein